MTGNKEWFISLNQQTKGSITFGNNSKGEVVGLGKVRIFVRIFVNNVTLVDNLTFDLLSVRQLCQDGQNRVVFTANECLVENISTGKVPLRGCPENNLYKVDPSFIPEEELCLTVQAEESNLWHRRFCHASLRLLSKLHSKDLVVGLPKIESHAEEICVACT